jgi:exodeoxyribonuclease V alpha subunit
MAWHDNKWDGNICKEPELNIYCNGEHSQLSARIARNKKTDVENANTGKKFDEIEGYQPPCFWSCNAFSEQECEIRHDHPFEGIEVDAIEQNMPPYSVFTWPFRISFNHDSGIRKIEGTYPPIELLERNVEGFFDENKLKEEETMIFFYLNFDNPISAEEGKYALVGCSLLKRVSDRTRYDFDPGVLQNWRANNL